MIAMFSQLGKNNSSVLYDVFDETSVKRLEEALSFVPNFTSMDQLETRKDELATVEIIFSTWGAPTFTKEQLETYFPALKAYFYGAGSVQYFAKPYLEQGVRVFSAAAANAVPVAEYCLAQIILANKGYYQSSRLYKAQGWQDAKDNFKQMPGNYDETVGLIGCGAIARDLIQLMKPLNLEIIVYDPYLPDQRAKDLGVEKTSLEELFQRSLTVSNHLPNNEETKNMLNYSLFSTMRDYATFINTGRGAQVVEQDLIKALKEVPTRTAVLDVTFPEPVEQRHEFYSMDNIILTPHIAGSSGKELRRMGLYMVEECLAYLEDKPLSHEVTLSMLETMA